MKFFSPLLWYHKFDKSFDFSLDQSAFPGSATERVAAKVYGYEFFPQLACDGLLVSGTMLRSRGKVCRNSISGKYQIVDRFGRTYSTIREFLSIPGRYNSTYIVFADPGTFTYVNQFKLPEYLYDTNDLIDYYNDLSFDLAGSVDWPIIDKIIVIEKGKKNYITLDSGTKEKRRKLTIELAKDFFNECSKRKSINFIPFGTIQGYDLETYVQSLRELLKIGYSYIAIGGLATSEKFALDLLPLIAAEMKKAGAFPGMHLYARFPSILAIPEFLKYGVTSFDNTSSLTTARLSNCSYIDASFGGDKSITSMREPCYNIKIPGPRSPSIVKLKKVIPEPDFNDLVRLCTKTFKLFASYNNSGSKSTLRQFLNMYSTMHFTLNSYRAKPIPEAKVLEMVATCRTTVRNRPWEKCRCRSCSWLGAHITLTRSNERIIHTFYHNSYVHYSRYASELAENIYKRSSAYDWGVVAKMVNAKVTAT